MNNTTTNNIPYPVADKVSMMRILPSIVGSKYNFKMRSVVSNSVSRPASTVAIYIATVYETALLPLLNETEDEQF